MADEWKKYLESEGFQLFEEARKLTEVDSKNDPEDEPFRSLYKAREHLQSVKDKLKVYVEEHSSDEDLRFYSAAVDLQLGINYIDTEELATGEELINKCLDRIEKHRLSHGAAHIFQTALNQLGILWTGRSQFKKSLEYLEEAERLYTEYKHEIGGVPKSVAELLKNTCEDQGKLEHERDVEFENTYTLTLYYMAQVFVKLGRSELSAKYCHFTLHRQLDSHQYDPLEWALNAATLSQYFITVDNLKLARHCLASATFIFRETEAKKGESDDQKEKLSQSQADINRCWVKYGLAILENSKDILLKEVEDMDAGTSASNNSAENDDNHNADVSKRDDVGNSGDDNTPDDVGENGQNIESRATTEVSGDQTNHSEAASSEKVKEIGDVPDAFNLELTAIEEQITCEHVKDFADARNVFLLVQKWLNTAKEVYPMEGFCSDYVEIVQDHSKAFKVLAFFEMDLERQGKMHKRRIDMISVLLKELNPQHYLLICRQLMFELAETYSSMLDLKLSLLESGGSRPTPEIVIKINKLAMQSIKRYQEYLDSLKDGKPELPEEFPVNDLRPALIAKFCMGRLYSKFLFPEVRQRVEYMKKSWECYKFVVDYCTEHSSGADVITAELSVCQEMVVLMPLKMEKIRAGVLI